MQIITTLQFYLTPVTISIFKNTTTNVDEDVVKQKPLYTVDGEVN
jgi:hypothetical protein